MSKLRAIGVIVRDIQKSENEDDAISKYYDEISTRGLTKNWVVSVFRNQKNLPVLDESYDVRTEGISVLNALGIDNETQTIMWNNWDILADDIKASWIEDFKKVDQNEPRDVSSFTQLLIDLLTQ